MRLLHPDISQLLQSGRPYQYAHLVKFQRPYLQQSQSSGRANRFAHLTDGSFDIQFDDQSQDSQGNLNGTQLYIANKLYQVPSITEYTQARATNHQISLNAGSLGSFLVGQANITQVSGNVYDIQLDVDVRSQRFIQGDKLIIQGSIPYTQVLLLNFIQGNKIRVQAIDTLQVAQNISINISLGSQQIKSVLQNKQDPRYASFINRQVYIYRAYMQQGQIVGTPILIFKGIINSAKIQDTQNQVKVSWDLSSHWGDFAQVVNRITSDDFHRGLDINGNPQPQATVKRQYAYDKGFIHSQTSLNLLATFTVQVQRQQVKSKRGFFGIGAKVKVKKFLQAQQRHTQLDFQLASKSIPVIYGVRQIKGIPVFADTLNNNSSQVYVIYVLSQGQIGGIYDVYIDDNSLICSNQIDADARSNPSVQQGVVDVPCRGRADRGDVLSGTSSINTSVYTPYYQDQQASAYNIGYNLNINTRFFQYRPPTQAAADVNVGGVNHLQSIRVTQPQSINFDVFAGKPGQQAASSLVNISRARNFKIQNDYWLGDQTSQYWGPNHRLLDSAYIVANYTIQQGQTNIPEVQFIVRGKVIQCYNYDYSYQHYQKATGQSQDNFHLGQFVDLYDQQNNLINSNVQIIDKWKIIAQDSRASYRFRFSQIPDLEYQQGIPSKTRFSMRRGSHRWTMVTYNFVQHSGTVAQKLSTTVTSVTRNPINGNAVINIPANPVIVNNRPPSGGSGGSSRRGPQVTLNVELL